MNRTPDLLSGRGRAIQVSMPDQTGQNVSDRALAHIVGGGRAVTMVKPAMRLDPTTALGLVAPVDSEPMASAHHIFTFGYEGLDISAFIARAQAAGVKTVVDVRELPLSRKKGFSKSSFREALAASGIAYAHMPALGDEDALKGCRHRYVFLFSASLSARERFDG